VNVANGILGQKYVGGGGVGFFAKNTPETKKLNEVLKTRKIQKAEDEKQEKIRAMEGIKTKRNSYVRRSSSNCSAFTGDATGTHSRIEKRLLGKE
jgi:hypothetical protein